MKVIIAMFFLFTALQANSSDLPSIDSLYFERQPQCSLETCLSLAKSIELTRSNNFESKIDALKVYQARQMIKVRTGQLLPSFNLRIGMPPDILFDYIPNLLGFLFPSNWFRLKESKVHALASEQSYYSLMANQINTTESLYYNINKELISFAIYNRHKAFLLSLKEIMILREELGELPPEEVEKIKIFISDINLNQMTLEESFEDLFAQFGHGLNLPNNWKDYEIEGVDLPDLSMVSPIEFEDYYQQVLDKSYELKSLSFLKEAAKYSTKARKFEFLTPDSDTDSAFGFGYISNINIGKANEEVLEIQKESMSSSLKEVLYQTIASYNTSLRIYNEAKNSLDSIYFILDSMIEDFNINSEINLDEFKEFIQENIYFQWTKAYAQHSFLLAKSKLDRLTLSGDFYSGLEGTLPHKEGKLECYKRKENRRIKNAITRGDLVLSNVNFTKDEIKWCL